jgi:hypothetical protein
MQNVFSITLNNFLKPMFYCNVFLWDVHEQGLPTFGVVGIVTASLQQQVPGVHPGRKGNLHLHN